MAKVYDPIMCMMVDKPDKAQDAKAKDRLVKVPDNKLKEFEASLRSAGFKVVSKSDRGMTTHYQVEVNSSKKFSTDAELREWAKKIDAVCDKMDSVAPTTWNIGLTTDGKITAGLDVREMYVKDSASVLDEAIKTADGATGDKLYADVKAIYNLFSNILLTYTNEKSVQKLANEGTKKCLELAAKVKGVRDEAIKTADESTYKVEYSDIPGSKKNYAYVKANSENEAANKVKGVVYSVKIVDSKTIDEAIKVRDASTGHKVVVFVENYLRSIGKNNSTGKYDKIVQGVRSLLSQSLLDDEGLKKAAEHEADRLLKKYNL